MENQIVITSPIKEKHKQIGQDFLDNVAALINQPEHKIDSYQVVEENWYFRENIKLRIDEKTTLQIEVWKSK